MIKKITYQAKTAFQNDEDVPDNEKLSDIDMNEIKDVVNTNADELNRTKEKLDLTINAPLIYKGSVETKEELELIENPKSGYIYTVNSEQKNYIYSDTEWLEYNATIDISSISNTLEEQNNKIEENTTNILENSNEIKQNSTDISNIEKNVSQNTSNISKNSQSISDLSSKVTQLENKSAISAYNSNTQDFANNTTTRVNLNTLYIRKGNDFELTNSIITCKKNGFIQVECKIYFNSGYSEGNNVIAHIRNNNAIIQSFQIRPSVGQQHHATFSAMLKVEENDQIDLVIACYAGQTVTLGNTGSSYANRMSAFYL